jgi:hypothetical protein
MERQLTALEARGMQWNGMEYSGMWEKVLLQYLSTLRGVPR